ncbi:MAG: hypothetical protein IKL24_01270 [Clostridia bacterium]|nr:hypothetical protein [Clostridia bacterium]
MKKIVSAILLIAMALTLFSCAKKPEFVKITNGKLTDVHCTIKKDSALDKLAFAEVYNKAEVIGTFDEEADKTNEVIVAIYNTGEAFTLFYLGDGKFGVTGALVTEDYTIKAPELEKLYNDAVHPEVKFVKADESKAAKVSFVADPEATGNAADFAKAYNKAELVGEVTKEKKTGDVIVLQYDDGKNVFSFTRTEEGTFIVSGSLISVEYVIKSADLDKLYNEAVK